MLRDQVQAALAQKYPFELVQRLLEAFVEARRNHAIGGDRLAAVEGGRFAEAAFRMLEYSAFNRVTPLDRKLDIDRLTVDLANRPVGVHPDSIRLHIPRALRVVYDIRNNRDAAHLAGGVSANVQDSSLVTAVLGWVLAEFYRLAHSVPAREAQGVVDRLVQRQVPAVENIEGHLKVLRTDLSASETLMLLLYERDSAGAETSELRGWVKPSMRTNLSRTLDSLEHQKGFIHRQGKRYVLTASGSAEVERLQLHAASVHV